MKHLNTFDIIFENTSEKKLLMLTFKNLLVDIFPHIRTKYSKLHLDESNTRNYIDVIMSRREVRLIFSDEDEFLRDSYNIIVSKLLSENIYIQHPEYGEQHIEIEFYQRDLNKVINVLDEIRESGMLVASKYNI